MSLLRFGAATTATSGISHVGQSLDKVIIGRAFGAEDLSQYTRAQGLFSLPAGQLAKPLYHVAIAALSRLRDQPKDFNRYYLRTISMLSLIGFPLGVFLAVASKETVLVLFGDRWLPSARLLAILGISAGARIIYTTNDWVHVSLGRADRRFRWQIIAAMVTIASVAAGIPFGLDGVTTGYTASTIFLTLPALIYATKPTGLRVRYLVHSFWRAALASGVAGLATWRVLRYLGVLVGPLPRLFIMAVLYLTVYLLVIITMYRGVSPLRDFMHIMFVLLGKRSRKRA